ncbi:hypothetical protein [uncultured Hyphomicrobium sp.]|jgi:hypothetical protein|uniref:hypothetical protein n=1 Tax=uncultured Hyphomicrobium sp. TaxID=194373 RepID=UPI0025F96523|nr:hypothetical protein [uncultured Hyphomicrobium sp.]
MNTFTSGHIAQKVWLKSTLAAAVVLSAGTAAHATSAYLPAKGQLELSLGTKYEDYDRAWQGTTYNRYTRVTTIQEYRAAISYGITDRLSLDANGGYGTLTGGLGGSSNCATLSYDTLAGRDCQNPIPQGTRDGFLDTHIGLRYALHTENPDQVNSLPSVSIYGGAILEGDYYPRPQALGDGSSGWETGVGLGRYWSNIGFGLNADLNYANVSGVVPDYIYGSVGAFKTLGQFFVTGTYRYQHSLSGWDSGKGPYVVPAGTPPNSFVRDNIRIVNALGRQENFQTWEAGLGYIFESGTSVHGTYAEVFDGRNTAQRETYQLFVTIPTQILGGN